jgi:hypothetical protein
MNKKEEIKNKWFMRNDISLREAWNNILDEYAEYVAGEAWNERNQWVEYDRGETFKDWFEQFKAKENE